MAERPILTLASGGRRIGLAQEAVSTLLPWRAPRPLPLGAPWLQGLIVHGGHAVAVLRQSLLGEGADEPEVLVLVGPEGRLAIPGARPGLAVFRDEDVGTADGPGFWAGEVEDSAGRIALLDVVRLYTALGLHYN